jgi:hypothetical protein
VKFARQPYPGIAPLDEKWFFVAILDFQSNSSGAFSDEQKYRSE